MKTAANILLGIVISAYSTLIFANTFTTRITPTGGASWPVPPAVPAADNWTDARFWENSSVPPTSGAALNNDVVNIGNNTTQPHHYILRVGNIGNDQGNNFTINVFSNAILEVRGSIIVNNNFQINVRPGGTSIISGNVDFHNNGVLTIDGEAVVSGNIVSHNNSGTLSGTGVLYVSGTVGLSNTGTTNVTIVRDGNGTDLNLTAPVLSANVLAGPKVELTWQHTPQQISGFTFAGYQVMRDWAGQTQQQPPFDNIIRDFHGFQLLSFVDDFSGTTLSLADAPVYYVRAVYQSNSTPTTFRFSPISNKVDQFASIVSLQAPVLTGTELSGTGVRVRLNWTYTPQVVSGFTFGGYEIFKNGALLYTEKVSDTEFIDDNLQPGDRPVYTIRAFYTSNTQPLGVLSSTNMYSPFSSTVDFSQSPLPIELLDFSATAGSAGVNISWTTAAEINNNFFTIERSTNGFDWEIIAYVQGAGNSNRVITYTWEDNQPKHGISYYRLKQTDFDGQYEYFAPVAVRFIPDRVAKTQIVQAGANGQQLNMLVNNPEGTAQIVVADLQGRLIYQGIINGQEFKQQVSIDLPFSKAGDIIILRLVSPHNSDVRKIRVN